MSEKNRISESKLEGIVDKVVFRSYENGFTVARIKLEKVLKPETITGILPGIKVGDYVYLKGVWELHPEYGQQLKVDNIQVEQPETIIGIERYLGSGLIKGIGKHTAKSIVACWGTKTLEILDSEPYRLTEINGIGRKKSELIIKGWEQQKAAKNLMMFLYNNDISPSLARKIYEHYGDQAYQILNANPYQLINDIYGIGFFTADKIAAKLGINQKSTERIAAAILHLLYEAADDGHCFLRIGTITENSIRLLSKSNTNVDTEFDEIDTSLIEKTITALSEQRKIIVTTEKSNEPLMLSSLFSDICSLPPFSALSTEDLYVYHPMYYYAEIAVAEKLKKITYYPEKALQCFEGVDWSKAFNWLHSQEHIRYTENQQSAIQSCLTNKVTILTGGPGTGKSTIVSGIVKLVKAKKRNLILTAPTGRAAKRLCEVTGHEASTIHRLLEFTWQKGLQFKKNSEDPIDTDLLIVDEASMLDIMLFKHLLNALRLNTHIVLVGDIAQLPSIGAGNVLSDIIKSQVIKTVCLNHIFRQSEDSLIITNAHRIQSGLVPFISKDKGDFFFFPSELPDDTIKKVVDLVTEKIPKKFGYCSLKDIQVLAPMHKGVVGIKELNRLLQNTLNPSREKEITFGSSTYRLNDRIIQLKNNYEKGVFNGDFGYIEKIDKESQSVTIRFENSNNQENVEYDYVELEQITHSYAISIHKSQGSEFPVVVIPLINQHYIMLQRNLLYTAVTRAKELIVIVGSMSAIKTALRNNKTILRNTKLKELLKFEY